MNLVDPWLCSAHCPGNRRLFALRTWESLLSRNLKCTNSVDRAARSTSTRRRVLQTETITPPTHLSVRSSRRCSPTMETRLRVLPSRTPQRTPHQPMRPRSPTHRLLQPRARTVRWIRIALLHPLLCRPMRLLRPLLLPRPLQLSPLLLLHPLLLRPLLLLRPRQCAIAIRG